jgi:UDP-N-acetyl-2-amino-2-deoxyglucuronate dehydrogenase
MNKLRVGIIGCGNIFPMHAESVRQACAEIAQIAAVCDNKKDRAENAGRKYNCPFYFDYREMIDREKPDVIHICTPHFLHKEMSVYAAEKGVHIFQEKPLAINIKDALETAKKIEETGVKFGISFQNRYNPGTKMAKEIISKGELGQLKSAKLILTWCKPDGYYTKSDWKGTWDKEGGGVIIDQAIHSLDILRYLFGSEIEYVDATTGNRMHEVVKVDDEASGVIMFKTGAYVNFYVMNHYSYDDDLTMEIHGEKGLIKMVKDSAEAVFYKGWKRKKAEPKKSDRIDYGEGVKDYWGVCHSIAIKNFYKSVINKTAPEISVDEGLQTQWLVEAIYESGRTGKRVNMSELKGKYNQR